MAIGSAEQRATNSVFANTAPVIEPPVMANGVAKGDSSAVSPGAISPGAVSPAALGVTLVGAGAIAGAVATWAATRPHRDE
jgi:hypothetical protein